MCSSSALVLWILDVLCCYLLLFLLYINTEIGKKKMLNVRLADDHLYGKLQFTWLSLPLVLSLMVSYCDVLLAQEMSWMRSGT